VATLSPGQRTPTFLLGSSWDRYTWYLRLPCLPGAPWAGIVRLECSAALKSADAIGMAWLSQATLCRYASVEYKDTRAPQNLYTPGLSGRSGGGLATPCCCTAGCVGPATIAESSDGERIEALEVTKVMRGGMIEAVWD
jgi:hypothetical protein